MKKLAAISALVALTFGCSSLKITPQIVEQSVSTGVKYSVAKYPNSIPYLRAAAPVICSAAYQTNLIPALVIEAIQNSEAEKLKTPEAVLILNSAMLLYIGLWNSYGDDALTKAPMFRLYLQATCEGIQGGLPAPLSIPELLQEYPGKRDWPKVRFP